ncbi:uncharacterized protein LOC115686461 isoform X2 [Syzygium oleosum]|uniref:uncharacterized protein LOC115686461 isoform X2 n=1 Tax=Syzygium oleosum TaxID=219896 RepID=UPI0011D2B07F|nr:uncharacterized protein LOC115686461 isoform X2 [Syzygium oleosum]
MDSLNGVEREEGVGKQESGSSCARTRFHAQHRRSKSACDKNFDVSRGELLHSQRGKNATLVSPLSTRALEVRSPLLEPFNYSGKITSSSHRASLEKDIEQLQLRLQQEKSMRLTLERAMGRASSTLSPGHRHVAAKTNELISEIELLEQEVASREQHVLSLYRSIFDQCSSQPPSEQSSGVASPAHTKQAPRKHPSIITSAFCSSKKFPLRPLQALTSTDDRVRKPARRSHALPPTGKSETHFGKAASNITKVQLAGRNSVLHTLKDHLYECPSKLSEEMVRCMAAIYCWLRRTTSMDPKKIRSLMLSGSSTKVTLPQCGSREQQLCSSKSTVEISRITTDKGQLSHAAYAINNYRILVEQLEKVNVGQMEDNAQTAFWINIYNSLVMHAYLAYGIPRSSLRRLALFHKWLETVVSAALRKRSGEERQMISSKYGCTASQPLICFALCNGAASDPVLKVYTGSNLKAELEVARREFLQANVSVKKSKVFLPKVLEKFAREASISTDDLLSWVIQNVDKKLQDMIQKCIDRKTNRKASQIIEWVPYSSRFQYIFSKDLTEKPW